jgi:hypothetical protein
MVGIPLELGWGVLGELGITAIAAVGVAWIFFRYLGDKWITGKFGEKLEAFKHVQQREIEQMRHQLSTIFDRKLKLHAQEFDVLPLVWEKLTLAYHEVLGLTSPMQSYPNLDVVRPEQLEHFLASTELADFQKAEIRNVTNKAEVYRSMRFWPWYDKVNSERISFERYFLTKRIFIQDSELRVRIEKLTDLMVRAMIEANHEERSPQPRPERWASRDALIDEGKGLHNEIGEVIERRLWSIAEH